MIKSPKNRRNQIGAQGETVAARYLERQGYAVIQRNYRSRHGEIDIIAVKQPYLCFCEVKTRGPGSYGTPAQAVVAAKRKRLIYTAKCYYYSHQTTLQPRFDVIEVICRKPGSFRDAVVHHITSAFDVSR